MNGKECLELSVNACALNYMVWCHKKQSLSLSAMTFTFLFFFKTTRSMRSRRRRNEWERVSGVVGEPFCFELDLLVL